MGNSHPAGKARVAAQSFRGREFEMRFRQEQGDEAMGVSEACKEFGAGVESHEITPETFAPPGLRYPIRSKRLGIDNPAQRSAIPAAEAGRDRVPGSIFAAPFPVSSLIERIADRPAVGPSSDVEQWKHIPRKAESGPQAFL